MKVTLPDTLKRLLARILLGAIVLFILILFVYLLNLGVNNLRRSNISQAALDFGLALLFPFLYRKIVPKYIKAIIYLHPEDVSQAGRHAKGFFILLVLYTVGLLLGNTARLHGFEFAQMRFTPNQYLPFLLFSIIAVWLILGPEGDYQINKYLAKNSHTQVDRYQKERDIENIRYAVVFFLPGLIALATNLADDSRFVYAVSEALVMWLLSWVASYILYTIYLFLDAKVFHK